MFRRFITMTIVAACGSGLLASRPQSQILNQPRLVVRDHDGTPRLGFGLRDAKPKEWPDNGDVQLFFSRHDVKDAKGRIVTGLGFIGWKEGADARIAIFTLVPKPGAPNIFLAGDREATRNLRLEPLDEVTLARGKSISIERVKTLGVDPVTIVFEVAPPR